MGTPTVPVHKSDSHGRPVRISFFCFPKRYTVSRNPRTGRLQQERLRFVPDTDTDTGVQVIPTPSASSPLEGKESKKADSRDKSSNAAFDNTSKKGCDSHSDCPSRPGKQPSLSTNNVGRSTKTQPATAPTAKKRGPETTSEKQRHKELQKDTTVEGVHRPKENKVPTATTPELTKPRSTVQRPSVLRATTPLPAQLRSSLRSPSLTSQAKKVSFSKDTKPPAATTHLLDRPRSALKSPSSTCQPKNVSFSKDTKPPAADTPQLAKLRSAPKSPSSVKHSVRETVRFEMDEVDRSESSDGSSCMSYTDPQLPERPIDDTLRYNYLSDVSSESSSESEEVPAYNRYNIDANSRARRVIRPSHQLWEESGSSTNSSLQSPADRYPSQQRDLDSQIESAVHIDDEALFSITSSEATSPDSEESCEKSSSGSLSTSDVFEDTTSNELDMDDIVQRVARKYPSVFNLGSDDEEPLIIWRPKKKILIDGVEPIFVVRKSSNRSNGRSWFLPEEGHSQRPGSAYRMSRSSTSAPNTLNTTQQDWSSAAMRARRGRTQRSPPAVPARAIRENATPRARSSRFVQGYSARARTAERITPEQGWTRHSARSRASDYNPPSIQDMPEEPVEQTGIRWWSSSNPA